MNRIMEIIGRAGRWFYLIIALVGYFVLAGLFAPQGDSAGSTFGWVVLGGTFLLALVVATIMVIRRCYGFEELHNHVKRIGEHFGRLRTATGITAGGGDSPLKWSWFIILLVVAVICVLFAFIFVPEFRHLIFGFVVYGFTHPAFGLFVLVSLVAYSAWAYKNEMPEKHVMLWRFAGVVAFILFGIWVTQLVWQVQWKEVVGVAGTAVSGQATSVQPALPSKANYKVSSRDYTKIDWPSGSWSDVEFFSDNDYRVDLYYQNEEPSRGDRPTTTLGGNSPGTKLPALHGVVWAIARENPDGTEVDTDIDLVYR